MKSDHQGIPGTVELVDLDENLNVKHQGAHKEIVLEPQPSKDPNDPLNWSKARKTLVMSFAIALTFFLASVTAIVGTTASGLVSAGVPSDDVTHGQGFCFLLLGWANLIWQPLAVSYGRRPVLLICILVSGVICSVWIGQVGNSGDPRGNYYAARCIQGLFGAPVETTIEILVSDLFFVHERAYWMTTYAFALSVGSFLGNVPSGYISQNMGFQWVYYFHSIFCAGVFVLMLFFMEETGYIRKPVYTEQYIEDPKLLQENTDFEAALEAKEGEDSVKNTTVTEVSPAPNETIPPPNSYMRRLRLYSNLFPFPGPVRILRPVFILARFPHIFWAGAMVASLLTGYQILVGTTSLVFGPTLYNFSAGAQGLVYIAPTISSIIGCLVSGPPVDWLFIKLAKRRGGISEAEDRIPIGLCNLILQPAGYILYGVCTQYSTHWIGPVFGMAFIAFCMTITSVVPYSYVLDAAKNLGADGIVSIVLMRNTISFAITYAINPWIENQGFQNAFVAIGFIFGFFFWIWAFPVMYYGKRLRKWSAPIYYKWSKDSYH